MMLRRRVSSRWLIISVLTAVQVFAVAGTVGAAVVRLHEELGKRAIAAYRDASNGFHVEAARAEIEQVADTLRVELGNADRLLAASWTVFEPDTARDMLRQIDAARAVLAAAMSEAAASDKARVEHSTPPDRAVMGEKARVQEDADAALIAAFDNIIREVKEDFAAKYRVSH